MNKKKLEELRDQIQKLTKEKHIEILRIIKESKSSNHISENKNGVFVNMVELDNCLIKNIENQINFWKKNEENLIEQENKKNVLINQFKPLDT